MTEKQWFTESILLATMGAMWKSKRYFYQCDEIMIRRMREWGITLVRVALGLVFLWFGGLKLAGVTPVTALIHDAYGFMPTQPLIIGLGVWECLVGIGLLTKYFLRITLALLFVQMLGTFTALMLAPARFFANGNMVLLTMEGEFVIKNLVLLAAGIAIGGHEIECFNDKVKKRTGHEAIPTNGIST